MTANEAAAVARGKTEKPRAAKPKDKPEAAPTPLAEPVAPANDPEH